MTSTVSKGYLTFELWYFPRGALRQSFMACVTSQGHSNSTASKQKAYLLTSCILRDDSTAVHELIRSDYRLKTLLSLGTLS